MTRGAAVIYPKDAAQILAMADIWPGARVLEAGAGSGALSCWLLRAVGPDGLLVSYERRADFADIARANVERFFGGPQPPWGLRVGEFGRDPGTGGGGAGEGDRPAGDEGAGDEPFDRVVLDMVAPWECIGTAARVLMPGGVPGLLRRHRDPTLSGPWRRFGGTGGFDEPAAWESLTRGWHADGLAVRPGHRMVGHTGFLVTARRLAEGVIAASAAAAAAPRAEADTTRRRPGDLSAAAPARGENANVRAAGRVVGRLLSAVLGR